jgi:hypothetical protein
VHPGQDDDSGRLAESLARVGVSPRETLHLGTWGRWQLGIVSPIAYGYWTVSPRRARQTGVGQHVVAAGPAGLHASCAHRALPSELYEAVMSAATQGGLSRSCGALLSRL